MYHQRIMKIMRMPEYFGSRIGKIAAAVREFLTVERSVGLFKAGRQFDGRVLHNKSQGSLLSAVQRSIFTQHIKPKDTANFVRNTLIILCMFSVLYVFLVSNQLPVPQLFDRPAQIYQFQDIRKADKLFGQKEIDLSKIRLTGLMSSGTSQGFAIFELEGKSYGAIAVGETFGKAYFLKSIGEESVEIVYQGKPYQILMTSKTTINVKP